MRVEFRPSRPEDFLELIGGPPGHRAKTITALAGDRVLGVGGVIYINGELWASLQMAPEARRYPTAIHRAGLKAIELFRAIGARRVYANAQPDNPAAERWLERLGFSRVSDRHFVWRSDASDDR